MTDPASDGRDGTKTFWGNDGGVHRTGYTARRYVHQAANNSITAPTAVQSSVSRIWSVQKKLAG